MKKQNQKNHESYIQLCKETIELLSKYLLPKDKLSITTFDTDVKQIFQLSEMTSHIYGRISVLREQYRPNMFIKEFKMYIDHLKDQIQDALPALTEKKKAYFELFRENLFIR